MADGSWYDADIDHVIISEEQIREKIAELAKQVAADYAGVDDGLLLVGVLKGAVMFMADFARALGRHGPSGRDGVHGRLVLRPGHHLLRAWCASSRTSTATSPAGTCSSSRTSSTPG